ncbi:MAG: hypothetical protein IJM29_04855, partial [Bacteroidales bacterium]|nr:hypothetical protein [Bacteroidales bacterium]
MKRFTYIFGLALAVLAVSSCSVEYRTVARTPDVIVEPTVIITNRTTYRPSLLYRIFHRRPAPAPYYSHRPTPPPPPAPAPKPKPKHNAKPTPAPKPHNNPAPAPKHNANPAPAPSHNAA